MPPPPVPTLFPYTTLFRSLASADLTVADFAIADLGPPPPKWVFVTSETWNGNFVADRKSTRLNSSHPSISYAVFCLKKKMRQPRVALDDGERGELRRADIE